MQSAQFKKTVDRKYNAVIRKFVFMALIFVEIYPLVVSGSELSQDGCTCQSTQRSACDTIKITTV